MSTIKEQISAAVGARKSSLIALRERIMDLLAEVPVGVELEDEDGLVAKMVRVYTGASQWANRTWDVTIRGKALIDAEGKLIAEELSDEYWDGNNMHVRSSERTCLGSPNLAGYYEDQNVLSYASGAATRAVATRLPEALARYVEICGQEKRANDATLSA